MSVTQNQHNRIMEIYAERRRQSEAAQRKRRDHIYQTVPRVAELDREILKVNVAAAKAGIVSGANFMEDSAPSYKEKVAALLRERDALLAENGFSPKDFEPTYVCADCRDTGYVDGEECHCYKQEKARLIYEGTPLGEHLLKENFDTFDLNCYSENYIDSVTGQSARACAEKALAIARDYTENFAEKKGNLLLLGDTGIGKTFLSHCILKDLTDRGFYTLYLPAFRLFSALADHRFGRGGSASLITDQVFDCDLLIIDDLGTESPNSLTVSEMFAVVNQRLSEQKGTIISSNLTMEALRDTYSERIFSRLMQSYTPVRLVGDDIRMKAILRERNKKWPTTKN